MAYAVTCKKTGLLMSIKVQPKAKVAASYRNVMKLENMDEDVIG